MNGNDETVEAQANTLCKSCGLCCTGHLFIWTKLRSAELDTAQALGLSVFRSDPRERGFSQPCPLWRGQCTIYHTPHYPKFCHTYKCKLLKEVLEEATSLTDALAVIDQAKALIRDVESLLPGSPNPNFRERLVEQLETGREHNEQEDADPEFRRKTEALLLFYDKVFGVKDLVDFPGDQRG